MVGDSFQKVQTFLSLAEKDLDQAWGAFPKTDTPVDRIADLINELRSEVTAVRKLLDEILRPPEEREED